MKLTDRERQRKLATIKLRIDNMVKELGLMLKEIAELQADERGAQS